MTLDRDSGLAQARHARLEIGGIPWLYTPYLQFPIDDRPRTGFLPPRFGQSTSDGAHITVPFYWRPAPNYDWTLYPTYYSRRGTQLGSQFRYLRPRTDGEWIVEYMPEDEVQAKRLRDAGESDPESERWALDWTHSGRVPTVAGLRYDLEVARVGDVDYLRDFSTELIGTSASELESRGHAALDRGPHRLEAEIQHWQNLRPQANDPYRRWPRLHYEHAPGRIAGGLEYRLTGEMVHWALPDGAQNDRPTGRRYHLQPRISWPYYRPGYFLEPGVSLYHTHYVLDRVEPELESELSRSVPIATLDGGLFFERPFTFRDDLFLQTLEPRLFYVRAPFEAQDEYPVFDTTRRADSVAQLFQENRFAGIDRVGDANQLTLALTTRLLDLNRGREPLRASIGQIHYFSDREVGLTAAREEQRSRSDLFADLEARIDDEFRLRLEQRYDPRHNETVAWSLVADWQRRPIPGSVVNLGYRIREEATGLDADDRPIVERTQEMFQLSAAAPIGPNWNAVGAWQYSRLDRANLEIVGGLEFRKCCWAVRGVARRYRRGAEYELENTFMLEFELTGLGRLGDDTAAFLGEIVRDYDDAVF
nr:LPS assembly protein LptD [Halorhodospira abdelmalekii]